MKKLVELPLNSLIFFYMNVLPKTSWKQLITNKFMNR